MLEEKSPCDCKDVEHPKKKSKSSDKLVIQLCEAKDCIAFAQVSIISMFNEKAKAHVSLRSDNYNVTFSIYLKRTNINIFSRLAL